MFIKPHCYFTAFFCFSWLSLCWNATAADQKDIIAPALRLLSKEFANVSMEYYKLRQELLQLPPIHQRGMDLKRGWCSTPLIREDDKEVITLNLGHELVTVDRVVLLPPPLMPGEQNSCFPTRVRLELLNHNVTPAVNWSLDADTPPLSVDEVLPFLWLVPNVKARKLRITILKHGRLKDAWQSRIGEIMVLSGNTNKAIGCNIECSQGEMIPGVWSKQYLNDSCTGYGVTDLPGQSPTDGFRSKPSTESQRESSVTLDLGAETLVEEVRFVPANPVGYESRPGWGFPWFFDLELCTDESFTHSAFLFSCRKSPASRELENSFSTTDLNIYSFKGYSKPMRYLRLSIKRSRPILPLLHGWALSEIQVYSKGQNVALGKKFTTTDAVDTYDPQRWTVEALTDGYSSTGKLQELPDYLERMQRRRLALIKAATLEDIQTNMRNRLTERLVFIVAGAVAILTAALLWFWWSRRGRQKQLDELRTWLSADLHDEVGSHLAAIALLCEMGQTEEVAELARTTNEALRDVVWLLRAQPVGAVEFWRRVEEQARIQIGEQKLLWYYQLSDPPPLPLNSEKRRHVFLAFKEALHNAVRHGKSESIHICVQHDRKRLRFEVKDEGKGFELNRVQTPRGIRHMIDRAKVLHGECSIITGRDRGTQVIFEVPL
jgi:signal transduction histidine kinase